MRQFDPSHGPGRLQEDHDRFPVHLIGLIQPHGVLLLLDASLTITQVSENSAQHFGLRAEALLGQSLLEVCTPATSVDHLLQVVATCTQKPVYIPFDFSAGESVRHCDGLIHRMENGIVLELEPAVPRTGWDVTLLQNTVQRAIGHLRSIEAIDDFLQAAIAQIQTITGYDRVMVYQFDEQNAGAVIAEVKPPEAVSYLGLHYPATDIPQIVRGLYHQNLLRLIPDLNATLVELVSVDGSAGAVDLSHAVLRGVAPCCLEYHQNMDVTALMVIALVRENQLWGLIACHHPTAKFLSYPVRAACEMLGQLVAAEVTSKVDRDALNYLHQLRAIQTEFVNSIAQAQDFKQALIHPEPRLLEMVNAQGAAICLDDDITLIGDTPPLDAMQTLIQWALTPSSGELFHTNCLANHYAHADGIQAKASGLIVLTISRLRRYLILWFRPEKLQVVNWAGNPGDSVQTTEDGAIMLCPRNSFEAWKETVEATAQPWQPAELDNAIALKNAIVGIVLNKADELAEINLELARSNDELESFAYAASHDLKEPLRGITNFSHLLLRRYGETLDDVGIQRLKTLVKLAERMDRLIDALLKFSRLGQTSLRCQPTDLNQLLPKVIEILQASDPARSPLTIAVPHPLPTVDADPTLLIDVFSNLLGNALKYTDRPQPAIEVGSLFPEAPQLIRQGKHLPPNTCAIYVKDDGIGIQPRHFQNIFRLFKRLHERDSYGGGTGVGLTIAKKIIERHGGEIWVESILGEGTTFYFVLNCKEK
ncbi:ATP-binding protein [Leptothoe kymatousa]|uniref:histidine kinase n=1 Tax=Leptothoe kymatousa TAU-MAC 1615 TaxID=2364775 RepID=A0ABS5Y1M2_9CYAN|nr:ATP-binding protein [Leptothoe kymatousa]MBT9311413.1 GAF domain-containing protein [Leptothoe kymatousa TAU-MAC 1615]